jgi:hypothetical protein
MKNFSHNSQCSERVLNQAHPEYEDSVTAKLAYLFKN